MVKAKKHLGQHFLKDQGIAERTADVLTFTDKVLEIGPGTGVLTKYLSERCAELKLIELDDESVEYLESHPSFSHLHIRHEDFLKADLQSIYSSEFAIAGNFPYNISTQIIFKVLEHKLQIPEVAGMFQKEVADRICHEPNSKVYGITSVLTQCFYEAEYLFTIEPGAFSPPPKVRSAVIRLTRKPSPPEIDDEKAFFHTVKTAFNQRRKTLRNSLKALSAGRDFPFSDKRPEQLSWEQFIELHHSLRV